MKNKLRQMFRFSALWNSIKISLFALLVVFTLGGFSILTLLIVPWFVFTILNYFFVWISVKTAFIVLAVIVVLFLLLSAITYIFMVRDIDEDIRYHG